MGFAIQIRKGKGKNRAGVGQKGEEEGRRGRPFVELKLSHRTKPENPEAIPAR